MFTKNSRKLVLFLGLSLSAAFAMGAASSKQVTLSDDGKEWSLATGAKNVSQLLEEQNILLDEGEVVFPSSKAEITENMKVSVKKGYEIEVNDNGQISSHSVTSRKVSDILKELNIELGPKDTVEPPLDAILDEEHGLKINRVKDVVLEEDIEIPFTSMERENPNMFIGERQVVQAGQNGLKKEKFMSRLVNGEKRDSIAISSTIIQEPVTEIIEIGTKVQENMIQGKKYVKKIVMKGSAYDPSAGSRTAMGTRARVGAVAVDPRVIPLGTKLYIESADGFPTYGFAVAEDTGGAIKGNRIDLFYNSNREANRFGRRNVIVYVLEDGQ